MADSNPKIIKKMIKSSPDADYAVLDSQSPLIEGQVYDASQVAKDLLRKAQEQANEILSGARQEAESLIRTAREEEEQIRAASKDHGYQQGVAEATEWLFRAREHYQRTVESNKNDLKLLAVKIAEKIIGRALEMNPQLIEVIVGQAIRTLRQQKNVTVRCNEADFETLQKSQKEFLEMMAQHGTIEFVADSKIARGGCIVESEMGVVDARLDTQLKKLQQLILSK